MLRQKIRQISFIVFLTIIFVFVGCNKKTSQSPLVNYIESFELLSKPDTKQYELKEKRPNGISEYRVLAKNDLFKETTIFIDGDGKIKGAGFNSSYKNIDDLNRDADKILLELQNRYGQFDCKTKNETLIQSKECSLSTKNEIYRLIAAALTIQGPNGPSQIFILVLTHYDKKFDEQLTKDNKSNN